MILSRECDFFLKSQTMFRRRRVCIFLTVPVVTAVLVLLLQGGWTNGGSTHNDNNNDNPVSSDVAFEERQQRELRGNAKYKQDAVQKKTMLHGSVAKSLTGSIKKRLLTASSHNEMWKRGAPVSLWDRTLVTSPHLGVLPSDEVLRKVLDLVPREPCIVTPAGGDGPSSATSSVLRCERLPDTMLNALLSGDGQNDKKKKKSHSKVTSSTQQQQQQQDSSVLWHASLHWLAPSLDLNVFAPFTRADAHDETAVVRFVNAAIALAAIRVGPITTKASPNNNVSSGGRSAQHRQLSEASPEVDTWLRDVIGPLHFSLVVERNFPAWDEENTSSHERVEPRDEARLSSSTGVGVSVFDKHDRGSYVLLFPVHSVFQQTTIDNSRARESTESRTSDRNKRVPQRKKNENFDCSSS